MSTLLKFSELLDEYLELREKGPETGTGYTDKAYYRKMQELRDAMDAKLESERTKP